MAFLSKTNKEIDSKETMTQKVVFRDPERTRLAVDGEGWLHTGDIGEWQLNGTLKIIDRCAFNTQQALVKSSQLSPAANVSGIRFSVAHTSNQHPLGHTHAGVFIFFTLSNRFKY